jgi:hypothetical protein
MRPTGEPARLLAVHEALIGALVGVPFGLASSAVFWWVMFHGIRPRLRWVDAIEVVERPEVASTEWAVSFRNVGRRAAIDVHTHARLRLQGLIESRPKRWVVLEVPTNNTVIPRVEPFRRSKTKSILVLVLADISSGSLARLPSGLAERVRSGDLGLRGLMSYGTRADIALAATCSDSFSGARHVSMSRRLTLLDFGHEPDTLDH